MGETPSKDRCSTTDDEAWEFQVPDEDSWQDVTISDVAGTPIIAELETYPAPFLDPTAHEIRLSRIRPAERLEDPLVIDLTFHPLDRTPEYEALSYTWGTSADMEMIQLNNRKFPVTQNLGAALRRLRKVNSTRVIWIDALCINQHNNDERGHQVRLMMGIYMRASKVLVWLGDAEEPWLPDAFPEIPSCDVSHELRLQNHMGRSFLAAIECTSPSWWERVWIVQEVVVASTEPDFIFGPYKVTWTQLEQLLREVVETTATIGLSAGLRFLVELKSRRACGDTDLFSTLELTKSLNATDFRDKIYGILGLLPYDFQTMMRPDYRADLASVFRAALLARAHEQCCFMAMAASDFVDTGDDSGLLTPTTSTGSSYTVPDWVTALCSHPNEFLTEYQNSMGWGLMSGRGRLGRLALKSSRQLGFPSIFPAELQTGLPALRCSAYHLETIRATSSIDYQAQQSNDEGLLGSYIIPGVALLGALAKTLQRALPRNVMHESGCHSAEALYQGARFNALVMELASMIQGGYQSGSSAEGDRQTTLLFEIAEILKERSDHLTSKRPKSEKNDADALTSDPKVNIEVLELTRYFACTVPAEQLELFNNGTTESCNLTGPLAEMELQGRLLLNYLLDDLLTSPLNLVANPQEYFPRPYRDVDFKSYKTVFCTETGFVGVTPAKVCSGDTVALVDRTFIPVVLRPGGDHYQFVCYCFMPGVRKMAVEQFAVTEFLVR